MAPRQPEGTPTLTPLQREVLILVMNGLTNREIATRLALTPGMVGTQVGRIVQKLGLTSRAEIVARAAEWS
jgi:DNA-binding CsgD family transcriptional regulator